MSSLLLLFQSSEGAAELAPAAGSHAHTAEALALTQQHVLALADAAHGHTSGALDLTQQHALELVGAAHAHAADGDLELTQETGLAVAAAGHGHDAGVIALTQQHALVVSAADHGHGAEHVAIQLTVSLELQDAAHEQLAGAFELTQAHVLAIQDPLHAQIADPGLGDEPAPEEPESETRPSNAETTWLHREVVGAKGRARALKKMLQPRRHAARLAFQQKQRLRVLALAA